ncbi:hypothetical protein ACEWY4_026359 [Coilia grayii]|uniref:G-protein coupled receptors family 1 profile domain-containing protein n=1 Tax=Coilia grayii TaxID=363190 RepID=A0ABD1IUM3_9TELE
MEADNMSNVTGAVNGTAVLDMFCTQQPVGPLVLGSLTMACSFMAVCASVWILQVLFQRKRGGFSNDVYMLSLTVTGLTCSILRIPNWLNYYIWKNEWLMNLFVFVEFLNFNGRPLVMACICVDCYMAVLLPIRYMKIKETKYREVVCTLVWVLTFTYQLFLFKLLSFTWHFWAMPSVFAVFTIAFCDLAVLRALRKPDPAGKTNVHPQKQRALQTIINSFILTMASYLPPLLIVGFAPFMPLTQQEVTCQLAGSMFFFSTLGATVMPLLYLDNLGNRRDEQRFRGKPLQGNPVDVITIMRYPNDTAFFCPDLIPVRTALVYGVYLCGLVHGCGPPHLIHEHTVRRGTHRLFLSVLVWALTLVYGYVMVYITPLSTILALSVSAPVIVFCNLPVLCALRKPDPTGKTEVHPQKQRALQVIINSLVVTIATYPPVLAVSALCGMVNENGTDFFCKVMIPSLISPTVGSTIMPVLYLGNLGALRDIRVFGCAREG